MKKKELSGYLAKLGRKGGKARGESLSPGQRTEIAKKAAATRWKQPPPPPRSRLPGSRAAGRIVYSAEAVERSLQAQARGPIYPRLVRPRRRPYGGNR
jgi:hypothetical protein